MAGKNLMWTRDGPWNHVSHDHRFLIERQEVTRYSVEHWRVTDLVENGRADRETLGAAKSWAEERLTGETP